MATMALVASASMASAQTPSALAPPAEGAATATRPRDLVLAESLFREGRALMASKQYPEACPKLEESYSADPGVGTLILLAGCHEAVGRTATAWAEFRMAASLSKKDGRANREQLATRRAEALEPNLAYVVVQVRPGARVSVLLDGKPLPAPSLGSRMPVDPGTHVVEADANGYDTWRARPSCVAAQTVTVEIGDLTPSPAAVAAASSARPAPGSPDRPLQPAPTGGTRRWVGLGVGGAGIVALGIGAYFGIRALSLGSDLSAACDPERCANPAGAAIHDEASHAATVANVMLPVGLLATAVGTYLFLAAPKPRAAGGSGARIFPAAIGSSYGVVAVGSLP